MIEEKEYDSFACHHGDGEKDCIEIRAWAYKYLDTDNYPTTAENFLSKFMYTMLLVYHAKFDFDADQWGAVSCSNLYLENGAGDIEYQQKLVNELGGTFSTYIQCDDFEDGLAYTLKAWVDHYEKHKEGANENSR